jgi:predicted TPR repeat methyltransferase
MPYSSDLLDNEIQAFFRDHPAQCYLDIGAGAGKFASILRSLLPGAHLIGIESVEEYIEEFHLKSLYDEIWHMRAEELIDRKPDLAVDIAIIGDCIEHLRKSVGIDLIHYLIYRCRYLMLTFPSKYIQYSFSGHSSEAHVSVWDVSDFQRFQHKHFRSAFMNMVVIQGYLDDPEAVLGD